MGKCEQDWSPPPPGLTLSGDEIHVWRAALDRPATRSEELLPALSDDERQRAGRFHAEQDRKRYIVGRAVLRSILGRYLDLDPRQVRIRLGPYGRPFLAPEIHHTELNFNLAHSGSLAVFAFARGRPVGVDVEQVRALPDADDVAARFFSAHEYAAYRALAADARPLAFYLCWTRKEAWVKALGEGLAHPLDQFDVSLVPGEPARLLRVAADAQEAARWSLFSLNPAPGYVAALAAEGNRLHVACWEYG